MIPNYKGYPVIQVLDRDVKWHFKADVYEATISGKSQKGAFEAVSDLARSVDYHISRNSRNGLMSANELSGLIKEATFYVNRDNNFMNNQ